MKAFLVSSFVILALISKSICRVVPEESEISVEKHDSKNETSNSTDNTVKDLYVIRKVVYEIGILTDADNSTEFDNKTHEEVDISFFDPDDNGTFIDLSKIPIPIETNVSGVEVTGLLSSNFGKLIFPGNGSSASLNESTIPLFPDKQVQIVRNITTLDKAKSADILSGAGDVFGFGHLNLGHINKESQKKTNS